LDDLGDLPRDDVLKQMPERPLSKQERHNLQRKGQARGVRSGATQSKRREHVGYCRATREFISRKGSSILFLSVQAHD
jgi:SRSO17 transposase